MENFNGFWKQYGYAFSPDKSILADNLAIRNILSSQTHETDQIPDKYLYTLKKTWIDMQNQRWDFI